MLLRARSAIGSGTRYVLGAGGRRPPDPHPGPECDCTGFAAWAYGVDRYVENWAPRWEAGDWFESTALYRDARSPFGFVAEVPWVVARPGDLLVWPDDRQFGSQGHVGIVATATPLGPATVIHCSSGNFARTGDAIQETSADLFARRRAIAAWIAWVREG